MAFRLKSSGRSFRLLAKKNPGLNVCRRWRVRVARYPYTVGTMQDDHSIHLPDLRVNPGATSGSQLRKSSLVSTHISQQTTSWLNCKLELYPCSVRVLRSGSHRIFKRGKRGIISGFSTASRKRLRFTAANAFPALISQFGMTYHDRIPSGREAKRDLNRLLLDLRRAYPDIKYLWILEFQKRGTLHFHLWLTHPVTYGLHQFLAGRWNDIAEPGDDEHLAVHLHSANFIPWEMWSAGYLAKYLDKDHQKQVPLNFAAVGRFWGASRGLIPTPVLVTDLAIDDTFSHVPWKASKMVVRTLFKSQERKFSKRHKWRSWGRRSNNNYTLLEGRSVFDSLIDYHESQPPF
jgi:hypothetical protein